MMSDREVGELNPLDWDSDSESECEGGNDMECGQCGASDWRPEGAALSCAACGSNEVAYVVD